MTNFLATVKVLYFMSKRVFQTVSSLALKSLQTAAMSAGLKSVGSVFRMADFHDSGNTELIHRSMIREATVNAGIFGSTWAIDLALRNLRKLPEFSSGLLSKTQYLRLIAMGSAYVLSEMASRRFAGLGKSLNRLNSNQTEAPKAMSVAVNSTGHRFSLFAGNPNQIQSSMLAAGGNYQPSNFTQVANTFQRIA